MLRKKFRSLELKAKTVVTSFFSGSHATLLKDSISDIDNSRQYQPGDKRLDSKSSLKANLTMSRIFNPEKEITLFLVLDTSSSMQTKQYFALTVSLFLNYIGDMAFDRIGLISYSNDIKTVISPTNNARDIVVALENLKFEGNTNFDLALNALRRFNPNNSLIFYISDFALNDLENLSRNLQIINSVATNKSVALPLFNSEEFSTNIASSFVDSETGKEVFWNGENLSSYYQKWANDLRVFFKKNRCDSIYLEYTKEYLFDLGKYLIRS